LALAGIVGVGTFLYFNIANFENAFGASTNFASTRTGAWSTNSTWAGAAAPATTGLNGDNVTINTSHTVNSGSLTIDNGVTITINSGATLYITGNLVVKNNLTLNNSGTLIITGNLVAQNGANVTVNGEVTLKFQVAQPLTTMQRFW
jgi:hypothetical protein